VDDLPWKKIQELQLKEGENILFAPAKGEMVRAVFVDDVP